MHWLITMNLIKNVLEVSTKSKENEDNLKIRWAITENWFMKKVSQP